MSGPPVFWMEMEHSCDVCRFAVMFLLEEGCEGPKDLERLPPPFCGSGTTGVEALALGRSFDGIELNPEYVEMARRRIAGDSPLFNAEAET